FWFTAPGYVSLHRAAHLTWRGLLKRYQGGSVDGRSLGVGDCECFISTVGESGVGAGGSERQVERGSGERDWRQKRELVPEKGALVLASLTVNSCVAQFAGNRFGPGELDAQERRTLADLS